MSILTSGRILKLLLGFTGGSFPIFVVRNPQESGTGEGGSLSKNWPRRPRNSYKNSHWRQLRLLIMDLWPFWVNEVHMWISMEGTNWSKFEGISAEDWTYATILSWSSYCYKQDWITVEYSVELQRISRFHLSPSALPGGSGDKLGGPENCCSTFLQELVGRNNLLKLLSPHLFDRFYLFKFSYYFIYCIRKV